MTNQSFTPTYTDRCTVLEKHSVGVRLAVTVHFKALHFTDYIFKGVRGTIQGPVLCDVDDSVPMILLVLTETSST